MNILTFDLEDWFHLLDYSATRDTLSWDRFESRIRANTDRILLLLEKRRVKATFFCLGWIAERYPEIIRAIDSQGHHIGSHSYAHRLVYEMSRHEFQEDCARSLGILGDLTGKVVRAYRAPGFSLTPKCAWAFEELVKAGIEIDSSIFPGPRAHGGFAAGSFHAPGILETHAGELKLLPISIARLGGLLPVAYMGGGYFRLLPLSIVRSLGRRSQYNMSYFHPRDFDPKQPKLTGLSFFRAWRTNVGLSASFSKLEAVLKDFEFLDVQAAVNAMKWTTMPRYSEVVVEDAPRIMI